MRSSKGKPGAVSGPACVRGAGARGVSWCRTLARLSCSVTGTFLAQSDTSTVNNTVIFQIVCIVDPEIHTNIPGCWFER